MALRDFKKINILKNETIDNMNINDFNPEELYGTPVNASLIPTSHSDNTLTNMQKNVQSDINELDSKIDGKLNKTILYGGTEGQVLVKRSSENLDVEWEDPTGGTIELNGVSMLRDPDKTYLVVQAYTGIRDVTLFITDYGPPALDCTVEMGDGTTYQITTHDNIVHTYQNNGIYLITISGLFPGIEVTSGSNPNYLEFYGGFNYGNYGGTSFANCGYLRKVVLPYNISGLEQGSFYSCSNLETLIAPSITRVEEAALYRCQKLKTLYFPNLTSVSVNSFTSMGSLTELTVGNITSFQENDWSQTTRLSKVNIVGNITDADISRISGYFSTALNSGTTIQHSLQIQKTPTLPNDVVRLQDLGSTESVKDSLIPYNTGRPTSFIKGEFVSKIWGGSTDIDGEDIWSSGDRIFYSNGVKQYELINNSWIEISWNLTSVLSGRLIWTDGKDIYLNYGNPYEGHILNRDTMSWSNSGVKNGDLYGDQIWTDGYSTFWFDDYMEEAFVFNSTTREMEPITIDGPSLYDTKYLWTDGTHTYYSNGETCRFVKNEMGYRWEIEVFNTDIPGIVLDGSQIWSDNINIYHSDNLILDKETKTWKTISWDIPSFNRKHIWTDGKSTFYSDGTNNFILLQSVKNGVKAHLQGQSSGGTPVTNAVDITYDNTTSGLTATNVQDAVDELKTTINGIDGLYDVVIRTQSEFEALIASPTWLDAKSAAFVGDGGTLEFVHNTSYSLGIVIPQTVKEIHGYNNPILRVNISASSGAWRIGLIYSDLPTDDSYNIRDIEIKLNANDASRAVFNLRNIYNVRASASNNIVNTSATGFQNCVNIFNSYGTASTAGENNIRAVGFSDCQNIVGCRAKGANSMTGKGYGYYNCSYGSNNRDDGSKTAPTGGTMTKWSSETND